MCLGMPDAQAQQPWQQTDSGLIQLLHSSVMHIQCLVWCSSPMLSAPASPHAQQYHLGLHCVHHVASI